MATYKVIQDIEAEDKILGPLTLRQFIFALITAFLFYICFMLAKSGLGFMLVIFMPPALFFGFFALPLGRDQPTEIWALAKLRYFIKPRKRIWNQSGVKDLVTITAPKRIERVLTKGFSQYEVNSRLSALADTIDSRGWAVKNVNLNAYTVPSMMAPTSDRLVDPSMLPQLVPDNDIVAADDMLDAQNNPIAQQFDSMINQSAQAHREQIVSQLSSSAPAQSTDNQTDNNYWFMNHASQATPIQMATPAADLDPAEEAALTSELKSHSASVTPYSNLRTMTPLAAKPAPATTEPPKAAATPPPPMTAPADPAILSLAENNDLNVATLAREAKRTKGSDSQDEVVVSLR